MSGRTSVAIADIAAAAGLRHPRIVAFTLLAVMLTPLVCSTAFIAVALGLELLPLPYPLFLVLKRLPVVFPVHMLASGAALVLIPTAALLRRYHSIHRVVGWMAVVCIALGGTTALMVALASEAAPLARAGFFTQGLAWLASVVAAIVAIRSRAVVRHARLMLAVAAIASGAIWLRLVLYGAVAAGLPFDPVYAAAAWASWLVPLGLTVVATRRWPVS